MLHEFLTANRADLIERCRFKVAQRPAPAATEAELEYGITRFLEQLITTLRMEQTPQPLLSRKVSGPAGGDRAISSEIGEVATLHGRELLKHGFTIDQVVHDYGDLCQAITDLAYDRGVPIEIDEYRTFNRCIDNAIADAVTEFSFQRDAATDRAVEALNERLGFLAHELRNHIHAATLALTAIKTGSVGFSGPTGAVLERSLIGLRNLVDRSLADVRVAAGIAARPEVIPLAPFIAEVQFAVSLEAKSRGCVFNVSAVDEKLAVKGDRDLLFSAVGNLLQNAFKFTKHGTEVKMNARAVGDRILIEVSDHCGGIAPDDMEHLFVSFEQRGADKSGMGLGLAICKRSVDANDGALSVRNTPGAGCVFTIDLPRHALRQAAPEPVKSRRRMKH